MYREGHICQPGSFYIFVHRYYLEVCQKSENISTAKLRLFACFFSLILYGFGFYTTKFTENGFCLNSIVYISSFIVRTL